MSLLGTAFEEIGDTFFGGAAKDAARAEQQGLTAAGRDISSASATARADASNLFGGGLSDINQGFQAALGILANLPGRQANIYQTGNVQGQQQMLSGLDQAIAAMMGGPVDTSTMAPGRIPYNAQFPSTLPNYYAPDTDLSTASLQNLPPATGYIRGRLAAGEIDYPTALDLLTTGRDYGQFGGIPLSTAKEFIADWAPGGRLAADNQSAALEGSYGL